MISEQDRAEGVALGVRLIDVTDRWAMGEFARCLVVVWRGETTPDAFRKRNAELQDLSRRHRGKCALVEVVETTSPPPSDDTRRVAMEVFKELGADLAGIGFVIEGNQMKSALNRAILTGMTFFVKRLQPTKVFKHSAELARWVRPRVQDEEPGFEARLEAAIEFVRRVIGPRSQ